MNPAPVVPAPASQTKPLEIRIPVVKLQVSDIAQLKGLLAEGTQCTLPRRVEIRLRILGLVEWKTLPPCPKQLKEWKAKNAQVKKDLMTELRKPEVDWSLARSMCYRAASHPGERQVLEVTKAGKDLLAKGKVQVQVKGGCR